MNYFVLFISLGLSFLSLGQVSYEFGNTMPPEAEVVLNVDPSLFGDYKNEETGTIYRIDEAGISIISIIYSYISKEQMRESSKYQVRNGFLFGVVAGDSVPCFLEDDRYYFGIRQNDVVAGAGATTLITRANALAYILNYRQENGYTPSMFTFSGETLEIRHLEYTADTKAFDGIRSRDKVAAATPQTVVLKPSLKEWQALDKGLIFGQGIRYTKLKPETE